MNISNDIPCSLSLSFHQQRNVNAGKNVVNESFHKTDRTLLIFLWFNNSRE